MGIQLFAAMLRLEVRVAQCRSQVTMIEHVPDQVE